MLNGIHLSPMTTIERLRAKCADQTVSDERQRLPHHAATHCCRRQTRQVRASHGKRMRSNSGAG